MLAADETGRGGELHEGDDRDGRPEAADESDRGADSHYDEAVRLFGEGRYSESAEEFGRAIESSDEPLIYCNRAIAYIKLQEWEAAESDLRTCRDRFEGSEQERAQIDAEYRGLKKSAQGVRPRAIGVAESIAEPPTEAVEPEPSAPAADSPWDVELLGHLSLGTGAVFLTAAGMLDYLSADLHDEFIAESGGGPDTSPQRYQELRGELQTRKRIFTGLAIGGTAFALTGISILTYSWFLAEPPETAAQSMSVSPRRGGGSVWWRLRF